ncbi:MAG: branched-chain amino acid ABC transporter permease [candidate division KSB1 bacterium]|nr:branched-chain amino acid ABC transporter permease [candidate division KSB1 bacterium]
MLSQLFANGIVSGCLYALMALGFVLIYNTTRIFHIAHGAVFTASAYIFYFFLIVLHVSAWLALLLTLFLAAGIGMAIEHFVYQPLERKNSSLLIALLSSLGLYTVIVNLIAMFFGNETKVLRPGIEKTYQFGDIILTRIQILEVVAFVILFPLIMFVLKATFWGKAVRAVRDNQQLAMVMGIRIHQIRYSVFALGSALAAVAAMLQSLDVGMDPHVGMPILLVAAVAVIIGGVGTFHGAVLGAFLIAILQSLVIWKISARWIDAVTFTLLIIFLVFRPEGILGKRKRVEEALAQ